MRQVLKMPRLGRPALLAAALVLASPLALVPSAAPAQNILEMLFGGGAPQRPQQRGGPPQANFFADPFGLNQQQAPPPAPSRPVASGGGPAFCVRPCDGKYFALQARGGMTPAQMCTMFCPAGNAKVYYGSNIDYATAAGGQRYADSENAYAYRKALKPDCTCNGRDPAGLAQIDLSQDTSLRPGDIVATATGLAAYNGIRLGAEQAPDFTPVADYPGLTSQLRAKLGEMKVAPVADQLADDAAPAAPATREVSPPTAAPKSAPARRAAAAPLSSHSLD